MSEPTKPTREAPADYDLPTGPVDPDRDRVNVLAGLGKRGPAEKAKGQHQFRLEIYSPGHCHFADDAKAVRIPVGNGSMGVMANHQAVLARLDVGVIRITDMNDKIILFGVTGGIFEMASNRATLLAERLIVPGAQSDGVGTIDDLHRVVIRPTDFTKATTNDEREQLARLLLARALA